MRLPYMITYASLAIITMLLGLLSRSSQIPWPDFVTLYVGDGLWALLVFWGICFCWPRGADKSLALAALAFSYAIELSQLYQAPWLNEIRHTTLGGLILGFGFKWSDLLAYVLGITLGLVFKRYCVDGFLANMGKELGEKSAG